MEYLEQKNQGSTDDSMDVQFDAVNILDNEPLKMVTTIKNVYNRNTFMK